MPIDGPTRRRFGTWPSPLEVDILAQETLRFEDVLVDCITSEIFHVEIRPTESRNVLVCTRSHNDAVPRGYDCRSVVNGLGGRAAIVTNGTAFFTNGSDSRIYKKISEKLSPVTKDAPHLRFGDMQIHPKSNLLVSVVDDYTKGQRDISTTICAIDINSGRVQVIAQGYDFYAYPTFNADGTKLAFVRWSFPDMPWQLSQIVVADVILEGNEISISSDVVVAGEPKHRVAQQPQWLSNGSLAFIYDQSGWAQPWLWSPESGKSRPILLEHLSEDFIEPLWLLGESNFAFLTDSRMLCTSVKNGFSVLYVVDVSTGLPKALACPYVSIRRIRRVSNDSAVFIGCKVDEEDSIVQVTLMGSDLEPNYQTLASISSSELPLGRDLHALYTPPKNPLYEGFPQEKPPAIVFIHAGPHMYRSPGLWWHRLLYNSRGWAWIDVQYGGSTGFGREYMNRLDKQWGVLEVDDCVEAVRQIAGRGMIDLNRVAVRGASGSAYSVLQSLCSYPEFYAAGASHFGFSDLKQFQESAPKFLKYYTSGLVGGLPNEIPEVYRARSPLFHADKFRKPVLIVHGKLDKIIPVEQIEQMVENIKKFGGTVEFLLFEEEGHGCRKAENLKEEFSRELQFFEAIVLGLSSFSKA
ncbi:Alpha/Beta hydrolase protein [Rhodocollybia butyracea]|uniref:Alpha/Beta hydrolase protein n=1 Tax=Rhodocollybia butyracea TaxID=206335 RepID=A0A9P5UCM2_9AGAR|nr:Alpha/Beta hydrolase protein [Rhodocollybia butyracea]